MTGLWFDGRWGGCIRGPPGAGEFKASDRLDEGVRWCPFCWWLPGLAGGMMARLRSLGDRERRLLRWWGSCSWGMDPRAFYSKWEVTHEDLAIACDRSISTVRGWFKRGRLYRKPTRNDRLRLALLDLLLERYEDLPDWLRDRAGLGDAIGRGRRDLF